MNRVIAVLCVLAICSWIAHKREITSPPPNTRPPATLSEARLGFHTRLTENVRDHFDLDEPPSGMFELIKYDSALGPLSAYLGCDPHDGKKHPAIVWIHGGPCNSIGDVWTPQPESNDQSAAAYRQAGIVMMYPSLRGGNDNPGQIEGFYGEVDDVLAAANFLAQKPYVDARRIYLGGHSTGGAMVLLVCECSKRFRAVFCFGPVSDVRRFGPPIAMPFDQKDNMEVALRAPALWLGGIKSPTFIMEGSDESNAEDVQFMSHQAHPGNVQFFIIAGGTHRTILAPANRMIAQKILHDDGPTCNIGITRAEAATWAK